MKYYSTRGQAPVLDFAEVTLAGLANDGGLYVPETYPFFSSQQWQEMAGLSYQEIAVRLMLPYVGDCFSEEQLTVLVEKTYASFHHQAIAPLVQLDKNLFVLELFHGETLAFKDYALQFLGHVFDALLQKKGEKVTVLGATSGDTGSAAIHACMNKQAMNVFILHPHGRVSAVQRKQMTTTGAANVHNIAIEGTFDDCQDIVKALFGDATARENFKLTAVNSINWARILAQVVYYAYAALALGAPHRPVAFAVPTGNFGNVLAAYIAQKMGLPIAILGIGSNRNDILARFAASGEMKITAVEPSLSPSMDIQVSSNFERLLFDLYDRDSGKLRQTMQQFRQKGHFTVAPEIFADFQKQFQATTIQDAAITEIIQTTYAKTGYILDPHTAVGVGAARALQLQLDSAIPVVALACAHPAKFPDAVQQAIGMQPIIPPRLQKVLQQEEKFTVLENSPAAVAAYMKKFV